MKKPQAGITELVLKNAVHCLQAHHLPRIERCLRQLSEKEIWWRPNANSNSAGNLVLHLSGNVRQWIIAGLGGTAFSRERDKEFSERGPIPRRRLIAQLTSAVREACRVIRTLTAQKLRRHYPIQGYHAVGLTAVLHVSEHFAFHTGQIIYLTKLMSGKDLEFTQLPGDKPKKPRRAKLPTL
jgi:hypothetical protein